MIQFDTASFASYVPGSQVEIASVPALNGLFAQPYKLLLIGQKLAGGTVGQNYPIRVTNKATAQSAFGRGSQIALMAEAALTAISAGELEIVAVGVDDAAGSTAATKTVTITGPATAAGALPLWIGGVRLSIPVASADTATVIATAIAAAVNANADLPMTATSAAGVVTLTARNKGAVGNEIDVRTLYYYDSDRIPAGVTATIANGVAGATNPDLTTTFAALGDEQYHAVAISMFDTANLTVCDTEFASRWGPSRQVEGRVYATINATLSSTLSVGASRNGVFVTLIGLYASPTPSFKISAATAAVAAVYLQRDPARPLTGLAVPGILAPNQGLRFSRVERNQLLGGGISTLRVTESGMVVIERLISTYQLNSAGAEDPSFLDVTTTATLGYIRRSWRQRMALRFPREKITDQTIRAAKAETIALAQDWSDAGLIQDLPGFKARVLVEQDEANPVQMNFLLPVDIANPWILSAGRIEFAL